MALSNRCSRFCRFHLQSLAKVESEWHLVCLAYNFKRFFNLMGKNWDATPIPSKSSESKPDRLLAFVGALFGKIVGDHMAQSTLGIFEDTHAAHAGYVEGLR